MCKVCIPAADSAWTTAVDRKRGEGVRMEGKKEGTLKEERGLDLMSAETLQINGNLFYL